MQELQFEKWQALGNDYLIIESENLASELRGGQIRFLCDPHFGPGADGVLLLKKEASGEHVAHLQIFNPDGSEAELSGNGAREAACYLRERGWTSSDQFTIRTLAGVVRPQMLSEGLCAMDIGVASTNSSDWPGGPADGLTTLQIDGCELVARHVNVGNPQFSVQCPDEAFLTELDLPSVGAPLERDERFPNRTNVSFWTQTGDSQIRARIFERGVGETLSSGTGASGAAVSAHLAGLGNSIKVLLDGGDLSVDIGDDLNVTLTGWAKHVYSGTLSNQSMEELNGQ